MDTSCISWQTVYDGVISHPNEKIFNNLIKISVCIISPYKIRAKPICSTFIEISLYSQTKCSLKIKYSGINAEIRKIT